MTEQRNSGRVSRGRAFLDTLNGAGGASQAERPGGVSSAGHLGRDSTSHAAMRRPQSQPRRSTLSGACGDAQSSSPCSNFSAAELMQYRCPVGCGPSGKTWPRWALQLAQMTSSRLIPPLKSWRVTTASSAAGDRKLGQPVPESYFCPEENNSRPQQTQ